MGEHGKPRPANTHLYYVATKKKDNIKYNDKFISPKLWNGGIYDYYDNPRLPWSCDKCGEHFKFKHQIKEHKLEVHAY